MPIKRDQTHATLFEKRQHAAHKWRIWLSKMTAFSLVL